jgi:hypothetical protein
MATGLAPKCHCVLGLPSGSPKIPKIGTPTTLEAHNFVWRRPIEVRFEAKFIPRQELFNGMWNATYMQESQGYSWPLMVRSQFGNLTPVFLLAITCVLIIQIDHVSPF